MAAGPARRNDIPESIRKSWHHASTYGMGAIASGEGVPKTLRKQSPKSSRASGRTKTTDAAVVLKRCTSLREDTVVNRAVRDMTQGQSKETSYWLLDTLRELDVFREHPKLRALLDRHSDEMRGRVYPKNIDNPSETIATCRFLENEWRAPPD